ncbi:opine metallophore biosynthesis dehydrogenase [Fusobacterium sp.]|uniref:opine metallophore biosynthesis dehydrogenase n=1 Tax=Fusobacterium sp. TaxID=68766 RepID=UPI0025BB198C|nr:opine metallophore biosynthesis dehydrogenase [Fusobacterium sp.]MCI7222965.1 opine metallophore biosynthesis dehydrogenase [Fusobacterium sp.]
MKEKNTIDNVLIFGNGPVALHLYITLKKQDSNKVGIKVRDSLKAKNFLKELREEKFILEGQIQTELPSVAYGKVYVENLIQENEKILDEWENFILATPCDAYFSILKSIPLISLKNLKSIILVSPEIGSAYFLKHWLEKLGREDIEVISFSNYFGATNLLGGFSTKIMINALKGKIYLSSTNSKSGELDKWTRYLKNMKIEGIICKNPLIAESKNITIFVHSPFLFNDVSLNQIFLKDSQKRYIYKLYPEGPITKYSIQDMVELYHEIMELYQKMGIETFNLLQFLNDSYPVLEETLHLDEIMSFTQKTREEQIFLLYVRYCCILIDPYSIPDEEGRYFDFSKVEYSKIYLDKENKWTIPRRPAEDYAKLNLLFYLSNYYGSPNAVMEKCLKKYEEFYHKLISEKGIENVNKNSYLQDRNMEAKQLYVYMNGTF